MDKNNIFDPEKWLGQAVNEVSIHSVVGEIKIKLLKYLLSSKNIPGNFRDIAIEAGVGLATTSNTLSHLITGGLLTKQKHENQNHYALEMNK